jgi:hypothetical protein
MPSQFACHIHTHTYILQVISLSAFDVAPAYGNFAASVLKVICLSFDAHLSASSRCVWVRSHCAFRAISLTPIKITLRLLLPRQLAATTDSSVLNGHLSTLQTTSPSPAPPPPAPSLCPRGCVSSSPSLPATRQPVWASSSTTRFRI